MAELQRIGQRPLFYHLPPALYLSRHILLIIYGHHRCAAAIDDTIFKLPEPLLDRAPIGFFTDRVYQRDVDCRVHQFIWSPREPSILVRDEVVVDAPVVGGRVLLILMRLEVAAVENSRDILQDWLETDVRGKVAIEVAAPL